MTTSFAVVGPGRVGSVLARQWCTSGFECVGFMGRDPASASARAAVEFVGEGAVLGEPHELLEASVVLLSVSDSSLADVVNRITKSVRPGCLYLHTSGFHSLDPLEPLAWLGARVGSLHPLCPFSDVETGCEDLPGKPAVLQGASSSLRLLAVLARKAGLLPVHMEDGDRVLYHAACVLAANGLTALFDQCQLLFQKSCSVDEPAGEALALALMRAGLDACSKQGLPTALTGPVHRGDHELVAHQLGALRDTEGDFAGSYAELMKHAAHLAARGGALSPEQVDRFIGILGAADSDD